MGTGGLVGFLYLSQDSHAICFHMHTCCCRAPPILSSCHPAVTTLLSPHRSCSSHPNSHLSRRPSRHSAALSRHSEWHHMCIPSHASHALCHAPHTPPRRPLQVTFDNSSRNPHLHATGRAVMRAGGRARHAGAAGAVDARGAHAGRGARAAEERGHQRLWRHGGAAAGGQAPWVVWGKFGVWWVASMVGATCMCGRCAALLHVIGVGMGMGWVSRLGAAAFVVTCRCSCSRPGFQLLCLLLVRMHA